MITFTRIGMYGRMGNQMFQYATLYAVAKRKNYILSIPYKNKTEDDFTSFCLKECFPNLTAIDSSEINFSKQYFETSFSYEDKINQAEDDTDFVGNFLSEKYFIDCKDDIRKEFEFAPKYLQAAKSLRDNYNSEVVALHIRLGDYCWQQDRYPICNLEYYRSAIESIPNISQKQIFLFSDDIVAAKQILQDLKCKTIQTNNKYIDMCLMSLCDYHIIANSTFSWWGAWLSVSKQVYAPSNWWGCHDSAPKIVSDINCRNWCVL